ncbi:MAG: phosphatase PAP2 family protein [Proteobacteria bacterium]|nr:phosphatase PAP2 family protein [Pseudomonadota bacterium]
MRIHYTMLLLACLTCLAACGTTQGGNGWGENATLTPGFNRITQAAYRAAADPYTWVPLIGMALFGIDDNDEQVSDWAVTRSPVFDDPANAEHMSERLLDIGHGAMIATVLLTPGGDSFGDTLWSKTKGYAVEWGAVRLTSNVKTGLKSAVGRERPDGVNDRSFPSGHAASAFAYSTLARRNLQATPMNDSLRSTLDVGMTLIAASAAWARVEAQRHYPADVLASAALANFISVWVHDSFMGADSNVALYPEVRADQYQLTLGFAF